MLASLGGAAGLLVEVLLGAEGFFALGGVDFLGGAVGEDAVGILVVLEEGVGNADGAGLDDWRHW